MKYLIIGLAFVLVAPAANAVIMDEIVVVGEGPSSLDNGYGGWNSYYPTYGDIDFGAPLGGYGEGGGGDTGGGDSNEGEPSIPEIVVYGGRLTLYLPDPDLEEDMADAFSLSLMKELRDAANLAIQELSSTVGDMTIAEACEAAEMSVYDVCIDEAEAAYLIFSAGSAAVSLFASLFVGAVTDALCDGALDNIVTHCEAGQFPSPLGGYSGDQFNIVGCP